MIDGHGGPEFGQTPAALCPRCGGDNPRASLRRQLDGSDPHTACRTLDQYGFAGLNPPEFKQRIVRGAKCGGDSRRHHGINPVRQREGVALVHREQFGVTAEPVKRHNLLPQTHPRDIGTHRHHRARSLITHNMRAMAGRGHPPVDQIAPFQRHVRHLHQNTGRADHGIGQVTPGQHLGATVFGVICSFQRVSPDTRPWAICLVRSDR